MNLTLNDNYLKLFSKIASQHQNKIAVQYDEKNITYGMLEYLTSNISYSLLQNHNIIDSDIIGLYCDRNENLIISILSIWKSNKAYLPIDIKNPIQRVIEIIIDSKIKYLICISSELDKETKEVLGKYVKLIFIDKLILEEIARKEIRKIKSEYKLEELSYVIYTSGSTGKPKGVMVEHLGMLNHLIAKIEDINIDENSIIIQNAPISFDISVWQMFASLLKGGKTIIISDEIINNQLLFLYSLEKNMASILELVPTYLAVLLDLIKSKQLENTFKLLRYLLVTGETLQKKLVVNWFDIFTGIPMVNAYGPTEASDDITHYIMNSPPDNSTIPIGKPILNTSIYILDENSNKCKKGDIGEICVAGICVGRGYLFNTDETKKAFKINPFNKKERIYYTGDLGRYLPDGNIEFIGRKDSQIKFNGNRIELGEIEHVVSRIKEIREVCVILGTKDDEQILCCYYSINSSESTDKLDSSNIKNYLSKDLPSYMIPQMFVQIDKFPVTNNGKIDRKELEKLKMKRIDNKEELKTNEKVLDKFEFEIRNIWEKVLKISHIDLTDDFFKLGGTSIKAIQIINHIQTKYNEIVHVAALYNNPTIKSLANIIRKKNENVSLNLDESTFLNFQKKVSKLSPIKVSKQKNPPAIFVISPPRTGSTLLRVILGGHSRLFAPPELELLNFNNLSDRKLALSGSYKHLKEGLIRAIMQIENCNAEDAITIMNSYERQNLSSQDMYYEIQNKIGKEILIDKTANYSLDINILKRAEDYFQDAKYITITRNPNGVIKSYIENRLDQVFRFNNKYSIYHLAELVWYTSMKNIITFNETLPSERIINVKFEDLVNDPRTITTKLCRFLDLEFEEKMLNVYDDKSERMTNGIYPDSRMLGDIKFHQHSSINKNVVNDQEKYLNKNKLNNQTIKIAEKIGYFYN